MLMLDCTSRLDAFGQVSLESLQMLLTDIDITWGLTGTYRVSCDTDFWDRTVDDQVLTLERKRFRAAQPKRARQEDYKVDSRAGCVEEPFQPKLPLSL